MYCLAFCQVIYYNKMMMMMMTNSATHETR